MIVAAATAESDDNDMTVMEIGTGMDDDEDDGGGGDDDGWWWWWWYNLAVESYIVISIKVFFFGIISVFREIHSLADLHNYGISWN